MRGLDFNFQSTLVVEKLPGGAAVQLHCKETTSEFASKEQNYLTFNVNDV